MHFVTFNWHINKYFHLKRKNMYNEYIFFLLIIIQSITKPFKYQRFLFEILNKWGIQNA